MRCLDCHYSLEGLKEHRCPECGRAFDPNDAGTFDSPARRVHRKRRILRYTFLMGVGIAVWLGLVQSHSMWIAGLFLAASGFVCIACIVVLAIALLERLYPSGD